MSRPSHVTNPREAFPWLALAAAAAATALPSAAPASPCLDLAACLADCADATCQRSCMAAADAETQDLLHALVDCNAANCPSGSPSGCQSRFCQAELFACRNQSGEPAAPEPAPARPAEVDLERPAGERQPPSVMFGLMFPLGLAYASVADRGDGTSGTRGPLADAFLLGLGVGWDGNWLAGPPTSAPVFNFGGGLDLGLRFDPDYKALTPAAYLYFHYFFANDLTDGIWTFFGLGVQLEGGWNDDDETPFFAPQATVAFRWLGGFTMHVEGFAGPEIWFRDKHYDVDVGVVAGLRLSVGFQVDAPL